eukprot:snap_masked-scaffold_9-processed-gene-2.59-mRNA-1 protein AED:1.00 eAED:1.00 QI:0/0/0/0/1/1/3/0/72
MRDTIVGKPSYVSTDLESRHSRGNSNNLETELMVSSILKQYVNQMLTVTHSLRNFSSFSLLINSDNSPKILI